MCKENTVIRGTCHCGAVKAEMRLTMPVAEAVMRRCGCTFCRKHPAMWFADPAGQLELTFRVEPNRYRFGTKTADFLLCPACGVIVAATCTVDNCPPGQFHRTKQRWSGKVDTLDIVSSASSV